EGGRRGDASARACDGEDQRLTDARLSAELSGWKSDAATATSVRSKQERHAMATIKRNASAQWSGTGKEGKGTLTTQSGVLSGTPYSFSRRFGDEKGTNPEELIAAAHASCFTMALAFQLSGAGKPPESLDTSAVVSIEQVEGGFKISSSALTLKARVPGLSKDEFMKLAEAAKAGCPVSKVLNAAITLDATLE